MMRMKRGGLLALAVAMAGMMMAGVTGRGQAAGLNFAPLGTKAAEIERTLGARVGVAVIDTASGQIWEYRGNERFPLNSTFKALACGTLLQMAQRQELDLSQSVPVEAGAIVSYSPVTEKRVGSAMTLSDLCAATMTYSDNTAANLVLRAVGGPVALTEALRRIGDPVTRIDRWEPDMNEATPGDLRDTTTPLAMARTLQSLALGTVLPGESGDLFRQWLKDNQVSGPLLRAGLPGGWTVGDRTGAGGHGSRSVVAVVWPPQRKPLVVTAYLTQTKASMDQRNAALASLGREVAKAVSARP
nr:class A beta-lactamase [Novispirillum itersonii]